MGNRLPSDGYDKLMDAAYLIQDAALQAGMDTGREGALLETLNMIDNILAAADDEGLRAVRWWVNQKLKEMA